MWTLIIFIYAGGLARGDSVAIDHVEGFGSYDACMSAGQESAKFVKMTAKEHRFVCVSKLEGAHK